jgi:hypothetical protein
MVREDEVVAGMPRFLRSGLLRPLTSGLIDRVHYLPTCEAVVRGLVAESLVPVDVMPGGWVAWAGVLRVEGCSRRSTASSTPRVSKGLAVRPPVCLSVCLPVSAALTCATPLACCVTAALVLIRSGGTKRLT